MSSLANWLEAIYVTLRQRIWLLSTQVLRIDKKLNYKVMDYFLWLWVFLDSITLDKENQHVWQKYKMYSLEKKHKEVMFWKRLSLLEISVIKKSALGLER